MMNMMEINNYRAMIQYDPDIEMFRGEFVGLNGGGLSSTGIQCQKWPSGTLNQLISGSII